MTDDRAVQIALQLKKLNVSQAGIVDLLSSYPYDVIERQLKFLPYRKAKRKEAFIIDAIRNNYSPPKEFYYAPHETTASPNNPALDQNSEPDFGQADANAQGYGTPSTPGPTESYQWLESGGLDGDLELPDSSTEDGPQ